MCGIAGIFNLNGEPVSAVLLRQMTDAIAHRGPDGEGFYTDSFVGLGHRRLAIIDLSPAAHQPMINGRGSLALTYNGEIYNFQELRLELEALGHHFRSRSDSEVVLEAYAEWGAACLSRFNGMFAFAIWDRDRQELFLARDRYGIKPLYYTLQGTTLLFASEVKAILAHPTYRCGLDKEGLLEYFTFQNFFTPRTLYKDVNLLPAGNHLTVPLGSTALNKPYSWWWYDFREPETVLDEAEYVEELDRLFRQAVNRQLVSDVELGSYLSGGMDSGSITAVAASVLPYIKTFTCGFDLHSASGLELDFDERTLAELMSYHFKTEHYEMVLKAGDMERALPKVVEHLEEPRVGQSYPNYYVAQLASKFVKVVLSGGGGDELFGGYPWRYYRAVVNHDFDEYIDKYYVFWQRLIPNTEIKKVFQPIWGEVGHVWTRDIMADVFRYKAASLTRPEDYINHSLYFEAKTFLHGLLVVEDKLSMAHSLETRVPFLDNDLVDFAMRVPVRCKLANLAEVVKLNENEPGNKAAKYFQKTRDGKLLLRKVMERHIPRQITEQTKQGFSAPDASWFKGESIEYVKRRLFSPRARLYEYLDRQAVHGIIDDHLSGRRNRRLAIWSLLYVEEWLQRFLS
ncbi:MAG: asparagine synthase (glutamine-hydrolyzing) [Deltaproteobacteria bacterium RIFOXYA12_FULL_61_11]|nr:MAG: asparagine synthase (glutamine-hydrolyzing) [Deltaproteobacteria bacterium RIFOXYA12_FULL_61_11]